MRRFLTYGHRQKDLERRSCRNQVRLYQGAAGHEPEQPAVCDHAFQGNRAVRPRIPRCARKTPQVRTRLLREDESRCESAVHRQSAGPHHEGQHAESQETERGHGPGGRCARVQSFQSRRAHASCRIRKETQCDVHRRGSVRDPRRKGRQERSQHRQARRILQGRRTGHQVPHHLPEARRQVSRRPRKTRAPA